MKYNVYATTDNGDGFVTKLPDWDGEEPLQIRVGAFSDDVVIEVEGVVDSEESE